MFDNFEKAKMNLYNWKLEIVYIAKKTTSGKLSELSIKVFLV